MLVFTIYVKALRTVSSNSANMCSLGKLETRENKMPVDVRSTSLNLTLQSFQISCYLSDYLSTVTMKLQEVKLTRFEIENMHVNY